MPDQSPDGRSFARWAAAGSLAALAPNLWLLTSGHWSLLAGRGLTSGFYDAQARALMHGHLAVPPASVGFEGFVTNGATYMYQGPVPALLRIPVLAVTHAWDGRLTSLSLLLALVVLLVSGGVLHWRVRALVRPGMPVGRLDLGLAALLQLALGTGIALYLAGWPVVYHEAEMWGAASAVAALAAVAGVLRRPTLRRIAWAGAWTTVAVNCRVSVALGPILALGVLAVAVGATALVARRAGEGDAPPGRGARVLGAAAAVAPAGAARRGVAVALLAAAVVPLLTSAIVNEAKFRTPFGIPIDRQVQSQTDPNRKAALAANHGTIFGAQFAPTQLLAAVRPDAVGAVRAFPYVGEPAGKPHVVGAVRFDTLQRSLSAPTSMPLFSLLTLVGLAGLVRRRRWPLLAVLVCSAAGVVGMLSIGYVTTRYLADWLPFLLLGALAGAHVAAGAARTASVRRGLFAAGGLLVLWGLIINGGSGLLDGRLATAGATEPDRAAFVRMQDDVDRFLGRRPGGIDAGPALPASTGGRRPGDLFVVGDCAGLYTVSALDGWLPVERTAATGRHPLDVAFAPGGSSAPRALATLGTGAHRLTVVAARAADGREALSLRVGGTPNGPTGLISPSGHGPTRLVISVEPSGATSFVSVELGRRTATSTFAPLGPAPKITLGADPSDPALARLGSAVTAVPTTAPTCRRVATRAGLLPRG